MRDAYIYHRLRKYRRKQFKRSDPQALLKWRYWHKMYGGRRQLWKLDD